MSKLERKTKPDGETALFSGIRALILESRHTVARGVNAALVWTNFEIGRRIVEHEQGGKARAAYAEEVLRSLSTKLSEEFGKGYSKSNLEYMRKFFLLFGKTQTVSGQLPDGGVPISQTLSAKSTVAVIPQTVSGKSATVSRIFPAAFPLSWSHYVFLMGIGDENERRFYEIESGKQNWTLRELRRQFDASFYERLALSRNKGKAAELSKRGQVVEKPEDMLKNPYVLEFLGLREKTAYSESDLESAIIGKIEHFLLEMGRGFLFEARQKRFTFEEDHYFVDLVFYNRLLRCYVLIDLKIGKLTHQDLGQMQMYVNYYDRFVKADDENRTVGIVLCKRKNDALVEITLPEHSRVFARKYQLYLPTKAELKAELLARDLPPTPTAPKRKRE